MVIEILPPDVASQIAAGEVVERPASVVKELLENSLDAGATHISIQVLDAGRKLIEVADNGHGIAKEQISLAVERHATSKLKSVDDLNHIHTLGFRGEALASIGSVSRMAITSRQEQSELGATLIVDAGKIKELKPAGVPIGTVVSIENLFYNVPARLKFLKHDTTERRQIDNLTTRYALAYPDVRIHLDQDGRPALKTTGNGNRREVLAALYGPEIARQMLEVDAHEENIRVTGFTSPINVTRSNRRDIYFFVNRRPIQDITLTTALLKAYHTLVMVGRYPQAVIFLDLSPELFDVNVHPTKAEVRFSDSDQVFSAVQRAIRRALLVHTPVPELNQFPRWQSPLNQPSVDPAWSISSESRSATLEETRPWQSPSGNQIESPDQAVQTPDPVQSSLHMSKVPILRCVGQIANAFIVAEGPDGLYLVDQHAAHERILFERILYQQRNMISSQQLLQPLSVELPPGNARLIGDQLSILANIGFEIEPFGANTFLIRAIPSALTGSDPASMLRALVEDFEEDESPLQKELEALVIARVCKRAAVKAGRSLSTEEQRSLIDDLESCQSPRTCPHGRPTMIHISVDLLERQFGRRGAR